MAATYKPNPNKTPQSRGTWLSSLHHHRPIKGNSSPGSGRRSRGHRAAAGPGRAGSAPGPWAQRRGCGWAWAGGAPRSSRAGAANALCKAGTEPRGPAGLPEARSSRSCCPAALQCSPGLARRADVRPGPGPARSRSPQYCVSS